MTKADDDLVTRLRRPRGILKNEWPGPTALDLESADEITSLRAQLAAADAEIRTCHQSIVMLNDQAQADQFQLQAMRKALEENEEYWKAVHKLVENARETVRLKIVYDKRPPGLFQDLQNAVYICRGRNVEALRSLTEGEGK